MSEKHTIPVKSGYNFISMPLAAFSAGFGSMVAQAVLIRIFLEIYSGIELVTGVILCNWMLLTAAGAFLGSYWVKRRNTPPMLLLMGISAFMPLTAGWIIEYMRNILFEPGVIINFSGIFFSSLLMLLPFCICNGALFPMLVARDVKNIQTPAIAKIYTSESIGSILGGLVFGIILVNIIGNFDSLLVVLLLNLLTILILLFLGSKRLLMMIPLLLSVAVIIFWFSFKPAQYARQALFQGQEILTEKDSPYGNVVVTKKNEQKSFFLNGELMFSTQNTIYNEECVHFPFLQHSSPQSVLVISGDAEGIQKEIAKYKQCKADFVEGNDWVIKFQKEYAGLNGNDNFHIINMDALLYLRSSDKRWDVVLLNTTEPRSILVNRFFTIEFFRLLKEHLSPGGIVSTSLPSSANYLGRVARGLHSSLFMTLSGVFKNVIIVPGEHDYFIASDSRLSLRIGEKADSLAMNNLYVNSGYINEYDLKDISDQITKKIDHNASVNHDFLPVSCYLSLRYWLDMSGSGYVAILVVVGLLLLIPLFSGRPTGSSLWITGFTAASLEILILMAYQAIYGHIYRMTSLVFAVFMAGLALAAYLSRFIQNNSKKLFLMNHFFMGIFCLILILILYMLHSSGMTNLFLHIIIFSVTFVIAFLCGIQFILSAHMRGGIESRTAGIAYGIDLVGSAAGALFISALLLPLLGMANTAFGIGALNFIMGIYLLIRRKKL